MNYPRLNSTNQATQTDSIVSVQVEIPESLHSAMMAFLESRPDWDQPRVMAAALSLFLLQNKPTSDATNDRAVARVYLDSLFKRPIN